VRILFVCTGNTCRSPMAEALFNDMVQKAGLKGLKADSAGIAASFGQKASRQAGLIMEELGISLKDHRTRPIDDKLLDQADLILTMTDRHKTYIQTLHPPVWKKIHTLKEFAKMENKDISDPFGQSDEAYRKTAEEIQQALKKVLDKLKE
jgi:protein-tyrosine-phosphatase